MPHHIPSRTNLYELKEIKDRKQSLSLKCSQYFWKHGFSFYDINVLFEQVVQYVLCSKNLDLNFIDHHKIARIHRYFFFILKDKLEIS